MSTSKLRLGPLPRTDAVKLAVTMPAALKATLDRYAELHSRTHGEPVDAVGLIPHMLEAFMARDRGFRGHTSLKAGSHERASTESRAELPVAGEGSARPPTT